MTIIDAGPENSREILDFLGNKPFKGRAKAFNGAFSQALHDLHSEQSEMIVFNARTFLTVNMTRIADTGKTPELTRSCVRMLAKGGQSEIFKGQAANILIAYSAYDAYLFMELVEKYARYQNYNSVKDALLWIVTKNFGNEPVADEIISSIVSAHWIVFAKFSQKEDRRQNQADALRKIEGLLMEIAQVRPSEVVDHLENPRTASDLKEYHVWKVELRRIAGIARARYLPTDKGFDATRSGPDKCIIGKNGIKAVN